VHYPMPLSLIELSAPFQDPATLKKMVERMSQTLQDFHQMSKSQVSFQSLTSGDNFGRQTANEFFSRENMQHPSIEENKKLKQKLESLSMAKSEGGDPHSISRAREQIDHARR